MHTEFLNLLNVVDAALWDPWTMLFIAGVSAFISIRARGYQLTGFVDIWKRTLGTVFRRKHETDRRLSPFQATATSLAGTVGMGNMAGVATALSVGGPGAIFWMWVLAVFGMMTKAAEVTLAVYYRDVAPDGKTSGGPMFYIQQGLGWGGLAKLFSVGVLINALFSASMLQSHTVGRAFVSSYGVSPYLVTTAMAVVTAIVAIGGLKRIGSVCEILVPFMTIGYLLCGLVVVIVNIQAIPSALADVVHFAFAPAPAAGGFAGAAVRSAVQTGMARGMLSNEAGLGTAPMVHATADVEHPFEQGMWGAIEVFIDTTIVCTLTAVVILASGSLATGATGIELLIHAFSSVYPTHIAQGIVSAIILIFCLTTQMGFFIYFQTAVTHLFGERAFKMIRWLYFVPGVAFAGVTQVDKLWAAANISVAMSALPNLVALLMLNGVFLRLMHDYRQKENRYTTLNTDVAENRLTRASLRAQ